MPHLTITEIATATGTTPALLRAWEHRYGWPRPHRQPNGYRVYDSSLVEILIRVQKLLAAGATPRELFTDDGPCLPPQIAPEPVTITLEMAGVAPPLTAEARRVRDRLVAAIERRDARGVAGCCAELPRLHPRDRGNAVLQVIEHATSQLSPADQAWLRATVDAALLQLA
jgi:hypothetical protein